MATSTVACNVCSVRHITKSSAVWCCECDEGFCTDCKEYHSLAKATRDHITITIEEYKKIPPFIVGINPLCDEHREKYQTYCKEHENVCCRKCVFTCHKNCKDLVPLEDVVENVKSSGSVQEMEHLFDDLTKNIKTIIASGQDNLDMLNETKASIETEINQTRLAINGYLDKLEKELLTKLQEASDSVKDQIMELVATLAEKEREILECQDNLQNIKSHATDLQTFLGLKQIEAEITKNERFVQSLIDDQKIYKSMLHCKIDHALKTLTTDVHCFGEVTTSITPCDITLVRRKDKQAQMMVAGGPSRSIGNICLNLKHQLATGGNQITGCSILTGGKMAFINYHSVYLLILNADGSTDRKFPLHISYGMDVACIDENTAAVTSPVDKYIALVDLSTGKTVKCINSNTICCGITSASGMLVFSAIGKGLRKVDLKDESIVEIVNSSAPFWSYVTSLNDRLYYTNSERNEVECCDINGTILWTFTDTSVLKAPRSIDVDEYGNVYVVGTDSVNVIVISPDGKEHRQLLSKADRLDDPRALHYDRQTRQLLVANAARSAFSYSVDYQ
jgi:ferritin